MIARKFVISISATVALLAAAPNQSSGQGQGQHGQGATQGHGQSSEKSNQANTAASGQQNLESRDRAFLMTAAEGGQMEVQIAKAATERASRTEVKAFAQRLLADHTSANQELMSIAKQLNVEVTPNTEQTRRNDVEPMMRLSGAEFDKAFIRHQVAHHQKDVAQFEQQSRTATDPTIKAFAAKQLPILREHLETAQNLSRQIEK